MSDAPRIHPTALIEDGVSIGAETAIWDNAHIRKGARIGAQCIVGEKAYIAYDVEIGDLCKLNTAVYLCAGVTLGRGVMVAAHTVFTNELLPRATDPELTRLRPSEPGDATLRTQVGDGATIGANCTIGPGLRLGEWCTIGMASVVTRDVPPHALVVGNPARIAGITCRCGAVIGRGDSYTLPPGEHDCECGQRVPWGL